MAVIADPNITETTTVECGAVSIPVDAHRWVLENNCSTIDSLYLSRMPVRDVCYSCL